MWLFSRPNAGCHALASSRASRCETARASARRTRQGQQEQRVADSTRESRDPVCHAVVVDDCAAWHSRGPLEPARGRVDELAALELRDSVQGHLHGAPRVIQVEGDAVRTCPRLGPPQFDLIVRSAAT